MSETTSSASSSTLQPVLSSLGYTERAQQRAFAGLLAATGAYGELPEVKGALTDRQADALLENVTYDSPKAAAEWLHRVTQGAWLRGKGERCDCPEAQALADQREILLPKLRALGMVDDFPPRKEHYDEVLLLGATAGAVDLRLETLKELWDKGVRFDKLTLLTADRPLHEGMESEAIAKGLRTEAEMMQDRVMAAHVKWPEELQRVKIAAVETFAKENSARANTADTVRSWRKTNPTSHSVLVISNQPYVQYQHEAVVAEAPAGIMVETVGAGVSPEKLQMNLALDSLAREVDVGLPRMLKELAEKTAAAPARAEQGAPLVMLDPMNIQSDPAAYQFRSQADAKTGEVKGHAFSGDYDQYLAMKPLLVHELKDGTLKVADGSNRLAHAKRLREEGKGPALIAAKVLKEADGYSAHDMKVIGAYLNLAEEFRHDGAQHSERELADAARVLRDAAKVDRQKLPVLKPTPELEMAWQASKLSDGAFVAVEKGEVPVEAAAMVAEHVLEPAQQESVIGILKRRFAHARLAEATNGVEGFPSGGAVARLMAERQQKGAGVEL